jgi:hypothetical protein
VYVASIRMYIYGKSNNSLVELRSDEQRHILVPKDLSNPSPSSAGLLKLGTEGLSIIVILNHHLPEVLADFNPLEHIPMNHELLADSQR